MPNYRIRKLKGLKKYIKNFKSTKYFKRFLTSKDMAEARREEAIFNSMVKRGELPHKHTDMTVCGCGSEGCIFCSYREPYLPLKHKEKEKKKKIEVLTTEELKKRLSE